MCPKLRASIIIDLFTPQTTVTPMYYMINKVKNHMFDHMINHMLL